MKSVIAALSLSAFVLIAATRGTEAPSPACVSLLDSGDAGYRRFDNTTALELYTRAYQECPGSYGTLMKMTRAFIDAGENRNKAESAELYNEGLRYADTMQKRYPDSAQSWFLSPENIDGFLELAKSKIARGRNEEAIVLLKKMQNIPNTWHLDGKFKGEGARLLKQLHSFGGEKL